MSNLNSEAINFAHHVLEQSKGYPEKIAMRDCYEDLTYQQLIERVLKTATGLRSMGLRTGDHVIILLEDCIDWPVIFLACLHQGIIPLPLSTVMGSNLFWKTVTLSDCKCIITTDQSAEQFKNRIQTIGKSQIQNFYDTQSTNIDPVWAHPDQVAYLCISSGSTGTPKIVMHRHQVFFEVLRSDPCLILGLTKDRTILSTPKMSWNFGLQNSITCALGLGATAVVISEPPAPAVIFEYLERFRPNVIITGPSIIRRLLASEYDHYPMPDSVKVCKYSGEHLPTTLYDGFLQRFGLPLLSIMGMTETQFYAADTVENHDRGTLGKLLPGFNIKLIDSEIYVSAPTNAWGYYKNYRKTQHSFIGEWVKTGDRGFWNDRGNLVFAGRVDDVFKVNDLIVNPVEVEEEILKLGTVEQVSVVGIANTHGMVQVHAFLIVGPVFDLDVFKSQLTQNLFRHQIPKHIHLVSSLPETVTNKKDRRILKNQLENVVAL